MPEAEVASALSVVSGQDGLRPTPNSFPDQPPWSIQQFMSHCGVDSQPKAIFGQNIRTMTSPGVSNTRKRRRPAYSCVSCRRRKVRCDRANPCQQCVTQNIASICTYEQNRNARVGRETVPSTTNEANYQRQNVLQEGNSGQPSHTPHASSQQAASTTGQIRGMVSKTRVFGQGHWMNIFSLVS